MDVNLLKTVQALIKPLQSKMNQLMSRGKIEQINDTPPFQQFQVSYGENDVQNQVERIQNFGFTAVPPKDSECVSLFLGGQKEFPVILAADHRESRLTGLKEGESAQYNSDGSKIHLKLGGELEIDLTPGGKLKIDNGTFELVSLIVELAEQVAAIQVPPQTGGPILNMAQIQIIKTKLESFKV
jgi:phage baseplate assembly protein V